MTGPMGSTVKYLLDESEMPTQWFNIIPDLPEPPPPLPHPATYAPVGLDDLAPPVPEPAIQEAFGVVAPPSDGPKVTFCVRKPLP